MSSNSSKTKLTKTLVRNTERNFCGFSRARASKLSVINMDGVGGVPPKSAITKTSRKLSPSTKYSDPELLTSNAFIKYMKSVEDMPTRKYDYKDIEGEDRISADSEKAKRLNFHFNEKVYKDLVALNINEEDMKRHMKTRPSSIKLIPTSRRDIEPNLQDFFSQEEQVDIPIAVSSFKVKCFPSVKYNGLDFYQKFNAWDR